MLADHLCTVGRRDGRGRVHEAHADQSAAFLFVDFQHIAGSQQA
jgi:hypothetical protein